MTDHYNDPYYFLTIKEAAARLGLSTRQVSRLIETGEIPVWRPSPQVVRIPFWELVKKISGNDLGHNNPQPALSVVEETR